MARRGRGYYGSWEEMIVGIQKGCQDALEPTAEELLQGINDLISQIYESEPRVYTRTMEIQNSVTYAIGDLAICFYFRGKSFFTIDTMHHHYLAQDYDVESMVESVGEQHRLDNLLDDIKSYVQQNFSRIYKRYCREMGLSIT